MVMAEVTPTELKAVEDLKKEYAERVKGTDQLATDLHWIWYLREKYKLDDAKDVFFEIQKTPFVHGLTNILEYLRDKGMTHKQFYNAIKVDAAALYGQQLFDNGLVTSAPDQAFIDITEDTALECINVFSPQKGMDLSGSVCPPEMSHPASVTWFRFLERSHALYHLPPVNDMASSLRADNLVQQNVLESNDFTAYIMTAKEREDSIKLVESKLVIVGGLDS